MAKKKEGVQTKLFREEEMQEKVATAIRRLQAFEPPEGYWLAFSGGKDSQCIYHLAQMAGVKFEPHYTVTTIDPPELMRFIRDNYPDVKWDYPRDKKTGRYTSMWKIIEQHTVPPTRVVRYCCAELKEDGGKGRFVVTGVRWAESVRRKALHGVVNVRTESKKLIHEALANNEEAKLNSKGGLIFMGDNAETRQMTEQCYLKRRTTLNPIVDWEDEDVWDFLNDIAKIPHCCLYDEGKTRLGCIGCPLQGRKGMLADFERWPRYKELYIRAFDRMIKAHPDEVYRADGLKDEAYAGGGNPSQSGLSGAPDNAPSGLPNGDQSRAPNTLPERADGKPRLDKAAEWNNPETGKIDGGGVLGGWTRHID